MPERTTLVATLGGRPQLVTYLLDLLLARGEPVDQVVVVYLTQYRRSREALDRLKREFAGDLYSGRPCPLVGGPISTGGMDLVDVRTPEEVEAVRVSVQRLLGGLKEQGWRIHLGLSGGRRILSFVALAAAMQFFTPVDQIWHVYANPDLPDGQDANLHAAPGPDLRLVPVPFVPWVSYFPGLSSLLKRSPQEMGEASLGWLSEADRSRCEQLWEALTARQREVLQAFAAGLARQKVADRLGIAVTTVDSHRESILSQCSLVWDLQEGEEFNVRFLQRYFGAFLAGRKQP